MHLQRAAASLREVFVSRPVFVFGSNLAGRHGKGAARYALEQEGAAYGQGVGLQGNSYAIPTKDEQIRALPLDRIAEYVGLFLQFATLRPDLKFRVTKIGCGLAGYSEDQIAPFFKGAPKNVDLPEGWPALIEAITVENLEEDV